MFKHCRKLIAVFAAFLCMSNIASFAPTLMAQDTLRTPDNLLLVEAAMPESIEAGERFSYLVQVSNVSDNILLHNVTLKQTAAEGFKIESVSVVGQDEPRQLEIDREANTGDVSITIDRLEPGEQKTVEMIAAGDQEGSLRSCIEISSYTPALCLNSMVVKPELEITKVAPNVANRCNVIELVYTVANGGSGDIEAFRIVDSLGEGLATIDGEDTLEFQVDGLEAGDQRRFVARVYAANPGVFSSRAVAMAENSDLTARSAETSTRVVAADLRATIDGPSRIYGDQLATFTAMVTNSGNIAADDVRVAMQWPEVANLVDVSDVVINQRRMRASDADRDQQQQPTVVANGDQAAEVNPSETDNQQDMELSMAAMQEETFLIDRLEPGETAVFSYAIRTGDLQQLPTRVVARYICTVDAAEDEADATTLTTTTALAVAEVVRYPALQMIVIDDEDPIRNNGEVVYTIRVWNEGDAADSNVKLTAELPENLQLVRAAGETDFSQDGKTIEFDPIDTLEPGQRADYRIVAKASDSGSTKINVSLQSQMLEQPVNAEEPTRIVAAQQ